MILLHTSDLHIGKRLADRERLPEQADVLDEIALLCEREHVSVVLIAGDVFDTYLPSAEAEEVFYRSLIKLAGKDRAVVIVSGNHDDGVRLAAADGLAAEQGIYIFGNAPRRFAVGGSRAVRPVESGENFLVLEDVRTGERVYLNALPYPNEARLREDKTDESYSEKMARWIARGEEGYRGGIPHILLSHLFVAGGRTSEGERNIDLGGARAVPVSVLPRDGYIALGHLHRRQTIGNAHYSGSILQYSFDEAGTEKCVLLLETKGDSFGPVREIPLHAGKKLVRLECTGVSEALALLPKYENCFIELTLHLTAPLTAQETNALNQANEGLVSLNPRILSGETVSVPSRANMDGGELFTQYYRSVYGEDPDGALKTAFLELLEEGT